MKKYKEDVEWENKVEKGKIGSIDISKEAMEVAKKIENENMEAEEAEKKFEETEPGSMGRMDVTEEAIKAFEELEAQKEAQEKENKEQIEESKGAEKVQIPEEAEKYTEAEIKEKKMAEDKKIIEQFDIKSQSEQSFLASYREELKDLGVTFDPEEIKSKDDYIKAETWAVALRDENPEKVKEFKKYGFDDKTARYLAYCDFSIKEEPLDGFARISKTISGIFGGQRNVSLHYRENGKDVRFNAYTSLESGQIKNEYRPARDIAKGLLEDDEFQEILKKKIASKWEKSIVNIDMVK